MRGKARFYSKLFLAIAALPVLAVLAGFVAYDPLQLYHAPWGRTPRFDPNMRLQAAGLIRHAPFDSVILGSSVMENYDAKVVGRYLGGDFANLSISASDYFERARVLKFLFRVRSPRKVLYSLDSVYMNTRKGYPIIPYATYEYLYDDNRLNDARVYMNGHYLGCLARWSDSPACLGESADPGKPYAWSGKRENMARFGGIEKWCESASNVLVEDSVEKIRQAARAIADGKPLRLTETEIARRLASSRDYVNAYIIDHVKRHPETQFYLVFPPYSRAQYAIWHQYRLVNPILHEAVIRMLVDASTRLANLRVFGFEDDAYSDDIANYMDVVHAHPDHDADILDALANGRGQLTAANVDRYIAVSGQKARAYDLLGLDARLSRCARPAAPEGAPNG